METDRCAMVHIEKLVQGSNPDDPNIVFLKQHALLVGNNAAAEHYYMFYLSPDDDERFIRLTKLMYEASLVPEILESAREARTSGISYILYFV